MQIFVAEHILNKPPSSIAGIGVALGGRLYQACYTTAEQIVGKFLAKGRDRKEFCNWIHKYGANEGQAGACYDCLADWSLIHVGPKND